MTRERIGRRSRRWGSATFLAIVGWLVADGRGVAAPVTVDDFADILFWAGSGTRSAGLVLQFPGVIGSGSSAQTAEPSSIAWGYRWNGVGTFQEMLFALAGGITGGPPPVSGSDPRLAINVSYFGPEWGYFINEITYDQSGLGAGWTPVVRSIGPYDPDTGEYPAQYQLDGAAGIWSAAPFQSSMTGVATTPLVDGGWYGFVQADGAAATFGFSQPVAAVPEPSALVLLAAGVTAWWLAVGRRERGAGR